MNPVAFSVGPISVHWYGLMYVVGITVGLLVAWPYARSKGFTQSQLEKVVYWAVPAGLVGARLYFVIQQPLGPYLAEPWRILAVWQGGTAFYGAIFAVVIVLLIVGWRPFLTQIVLGIVLTIKWLYSFSNQEKQLKEAASFKPSLLYST